MASIWRSKAFISGADRTRPERTLPWQAIVPQMAARRSLERQGLAVFGQIVGDVADQALNVGIAQHGRGLAHQDGAGAEGLDDQAHLGQFLGARGDALGLGGVQIDHLGRQQGLAGHGPLGHLGLHPLIDQPLVGGVLIDDDQTVAGLGDDIVGVELAPRGAQGVVEGVRGGVRREGCIVIGGRGRLLGP